jgi:hypothetical protein
MVMALYRAFQLDRSLSHGVFYPLWAEDINFTYGTPLFAFYPPFASYVLVPFHRLGLDWIAAAKAAETTILFGAGLGMYICARWFLTDRRAGFVSAAAFLFAPYLLINIYERGAIAESLALAILPWLFWSLGRTLEANDRFWAWLSAFLIALIMLAHNITAMFVLPILFIYLAFLGWKRGARRWLLTLIAVYVLGLGLSAFFWLPAILERGVTQIASRMLEGHYQAAVHLAPLSSVIQGGLAFDYAGALRFRLALWQVIVAGVAIARQALQRQAQRQRLTLLTVIAISVLVLQLDVTRVFWQTAPLVRFIQFPWRLLGLAAFCIAILAGSLVSGSHISASRFASIKGWLTTLIILVMILYGSASGLAIRFSPADPYLAASDISLEGLFERGRSQFTPFSDFLPATTQVDPWDLSKPKVPGGIALPPMTNVPQITISEERADRLVFHVRADQPYTMRFHRFFFPGWQVAAAGRPVTTYASGDLGLITADLPAGDYSASLWFGRTTIGLLANALAIVSFLVWVVQGVLLRRARILLGSLGVCVLLCGASVWAASWPDFSTRRPTPYVANLQDQVHLLGYWLPKKTWRGGETLSLRLYWLAERAFPGNDKVFIHLVKPGDQGTVAQSDRWPILGYSPTSRWEPGELIGDQQTLDIEPSLSPGAYWLVVGLYQTEPVRNLSVRQAPYTLPGDRMLLTSIEVTAK